MSRAERAALSDEKLIQAALDLIAECGIERVTLRSIGERAGYSRGLVNYRFGTKEALLREATSRLVKRWADDASAGDGSNGNGLAGLTDFLDRHRMLLKGPASRTYYTLLYAALGPMPEIRQELAGTHVTIRERLASHISAGMRSGEIRSDVDPERHAAWIYGAVRGLAYQWFLDTEAFDLDGAHAALKKAIVRSLEST